MLFQDLLRCDFAYTLTMQIILFCYSILLYTAITYWSANIIMEIYQQPATFKDKLLFSFFTSTLMYIIIVYGSAAIYGYVILKIGRLYLGDLHNIVTVPTPFYTVLLYFFGVKILHLSRFSSTKVMWLSYIYFMICRLVFRIVYPLSPTIIDDKGYNYLSDLSRLLLVTIIIFILYKVIIYIVKKTYISVHFPDNLVVQHIRRELIKNFVSALFLYIFVVKVLSYKDLDWFHCLLLMILLSMYMAISIFLDYTAIQKNTLVNKDVHAASLTKASDSINGIKRDFFNILQTYSGYLHIKNYAELDRYHQAMVNMTKLAGDRVNMQSKMHENPTFYSLLLNKLDMAEKKGIAVQLNIFTCPQSKHIDNFEFCKVLGILLDNALEAAEATESKKVSLSIEGKLDKSQLVILSNSTTEEVDIKEIMLTGFTTKPNHSGLGLSHARSILSKYGHCTLNANYYNYEFTAYLEIRDTEHIAEKKPALYLVKG